MQQMHGHSHRVIVMGYCEQGDTNGLHKSMIFT
jgi:hypothetical protein